MHRLGHLVNGEWVAHSHPAVFEVGERIVAGVPGGDPSIFERMIECLEAPYYLLYVLHTPRGEAQPGRHQSPALSLSEVKGFLAQFGPFLSADARFDLWAHSPSDSGTVAWDRHNLLFAYGPLARFSTALRSLGFTTGNPSIPVPHEHHYRADFDGLAQDLMAALDWSFSPLRPEDQQ
ncbi:hypothetical protein [Pseudoxanthomonas wuyuanensis]